MLRHGHASPPDVEGLSIPWSSQHRARPSTPCRSRDAPSHGLIPVNPDTFSIPSLWPMTSSARFFWPSGKLLGFLAHLFPLQVSTPAPLGCWDAAQASPCHAEAPRMTPRTLASFRSAPADPVRRGYHANALRTQHTCALCVVRRAWCVPRYIMQRGPATRGIGLFESRFHPCSRSPLPCHGEAVTGSFPSGLVRSPRPRSNFRPAIIKAAISMRRYRV